MQSLQGHVRRTIRQKPIQNFEYSNIPNEPSLPNSAPYVGHERSGRRRTEKVITWRAVFTQILYIQNR